MNQQTQGLCTNVSFNSANNQIATPGYTYDAAGNMTSDGTGVGSHTYQWDGDGRLKSATVNGGSTVSYVYNALGQQVDSVASGPVYQETYYDAFGRQAVEQNHTTTLEDFFPPVGGINFVKFGAGGTHFLHTDRLGTTAVITAQLNTEWQNLLYYPLGQQWQHADATLDVRFAKLQERDAVTGLDPTPARQYNSNIGRWMTPDPEGAGAEPSDPQTWNAYAYVRNNPTTLTDPTGERYQVCQTDANGNQTNCADISDKQFAQFEQANKETLTFTGGTAGNVLQNGTAIGNFKQTSVDLPDSAQAILSNVYRTAGPPVNFFFNRTMDFLGLTGPGVLRGLEAIPEIEASVVPRIAELVGGLNTGTKFNVGAGLLAGETTGMSQEAVMRAAQRGVTRGEIAEALSHVPKQGRGSVLRFIGQAAEVRVNQVTGRIVTVIRFSSPGTPSAF